MQNLMNVRSCVNCYLICMSLVAAMNFLIYLLNFDGFGAHPHILLEKRLNLVK